MARDKHLMQIRDLLGVDDVQWSGYANIYGYPVHTVSIGFQRVDICYERNTVTVIATTSRQEPDGALRQLSDLMELIARIANNQEALTKMLKGRKCGQAVIGGPTRHER